LIRDLQRSQISFMVHVQILRSDKDFFGHIINDLIKVNNATGNRRDLSLFLRMVPITRCN
jgi:hypothetical protein